MSRRHAPIPSLTVELVPVYRCGGPFRRRCVDAAYQDAAKCALEDAAPDWVQDVSEVGLRRRRKTIDRLARWLRWRDGRVAAMREVHRAP